MTDITIYTSANNGEEILIFPVVPKNLPELVREWNHEEFETNDKVLTLIGKSKRRTMSLELLLPVDKNYSFINSKASNNGWDYINFWNKWSDREVPMRLVITEGINELINFAYTIDSLKYKLDKKKDVIASIDITEYIFTTEQETEKKAEYKWTDISIKYNGAGYSVKSANVNGHWLVPVRKLLELLGYNVIWNPNEKAIHMTKEGISYKLKATTQIYEGTSYGYIAYICTELGFKAQWDGNTSTVNITQVWKWQNIGLKNGGNVYTVKAAMTNNRWIVPVRNLLEFLGYDVEWNSEEKAVYINNGTYRIKTEIYIESGISYCYLYMICAELGYSPKWDKESNTVTIEEC